MKKLSLVLLVLCLSFACSFRKISLCRIADRIESCRETVVSDVEVFVSGLAEIDPGKAMKVAQVAPDILNGFQDLKFALRAINDGAAAGTLDGVVEQLHELVTRLNGLYKLFGEGFLSPKVKRVLSLASNAVPRIKVPKAGKECLGPFTRTDYLGEWRLSLLDRIEAGRTAP